MLRLSLTSADVVDHDGATHAGVGVLVRAGSAKLVRRRPRMVIERGDVVDVTRPHRTAPATVTFADGATWVVSKPDCGCS